MLDEIQGTKDGVSRNSQSTKILAEHVKNNLGLGLFDKGLGLGASLPSITPKTTKFMKDDEKIPLWGEVIEAPSSLSGGDESKWEGVYIQDGQEVPVSFDFVRIDLNRLEVTMKGFDAKGNFIIEGSIEEGSTEVNLRMSRETESESRAQIERYLKGRIQEGQKAINCIWSFSNKDVLKDEGQTFKIFEQKEVEIEIDGNEENESFGKDDEKMSGFHMRNCSEELLFLVMSDLPSPLFVYNKVKKEIEISIPLKVQKGASTFELSDDKKMLAIAGTSRTIYLVNAEFILKNLVSLNNDLVQSSFHLFMEEKNENRKSQRKKKDNEGINGVDYPPNFLVSLEKYHKERIQKMKFIHNSQKLITCGGQRIKVFDIERLSVEATFSTRHRDDITTFLIMEDERRILTASQDKSMILTDITTGREIQVLLGTASSGIVGLHYVNETNKLIVGAADGEITMRNSFKNRDYLGVNGLLKIEGKDWIEKSNQTSLFRYYLKREPFFLRIKVDFFFVLFMIWENVSLVGLQELLDNAAALNVVPVLNVYGISSFEMFEIYQPPPIFSELLFYFYFRRMKSITRSEYTLSEQLITGGLVNYYIQRKGKNILTHFFTGMMIENATCNPAEVYLRGIAKRKFVLSDQLFCDHSGTSLYNPVGTTPLKVFRSKIRIENQKDWSSQLLLTVFQMFLGFSNLSSYPIEATQQYLLYLKLRTWKFAYVYIIIYILNCTMMTIQVIFFNDLGEEAKIIIAIAMIMANFITMLSEFIQLSGQGFVEYATTFGNYIEITQISLTYFFCFLIIFGDFEAFYFSDGTKRLDYNWSFDIMALTVMMMFLRLSRIIQYFDQFRSLVLKLNKILEDMVPVSVVLAIFVFGFALVFYIARVQEASDESFLDNLGLAWDTAFANYDRPDITRGNTYFGFLVYLIATIALPLVLLNFIIAVMGDTLNNISDDLLALDSVSKLSVCLDFLFIQAGLVKLLQRVIGRKQAPIEQIFDNSKFLYVIYDDETPAIKEETGSEIVEANPIDEDENKEENGEEEEKKMTVEDISQGVARITFDQITKMRERLEKSLQGLVTKSSTDLETGMVAGVRKVEGRLELLENHQKTIEQQIKRLEIKVNTVEEKDEVDKWGVPLGYGGKSGFLSQADGILKTNKIESKLRGVKNSSISGQKGPDE